MFRKSWLCEHRGPDLSSGLSNEGQLPDAEFSGLLMDSGSSIWEEETNKYPKWMTGTSKLFLLRCCWGKEPGGCICVLVHLSFFCIILNILQCCYQIPRGRTWSMLSGINSPSLLMLVKEPFLATCCSASGIYPGGGELRSVEWEPARFKFKFLYLLNDGWVCNVDDKVKSQCSPIKASMLFLSVTLNPVLSRSSWDGKRSILEEEFWRKHSLVTHFRFSLLGINVSAESADLRQILKHQEDLQTLHVNTSIQQLHCLVKVILSGQRNHQLKKEEKRKENIFNV